MLPEAQLSPQQPRPNHKVEKKETAVGFAKNSVGLVKFGLRYAARQLRPLPVLTLRIMVLKEALIHLHVALNWVCRVRESWQLHTETQETLNYPQYKAATVLPTEMAESEDNMKQLEKRLLFLRFTNKQRPRLIAVNKRCRFLRRDRSINSAFPVLFHWQKKN